MLIQKKIVTNKDNTKNLTEPDFKNLVDVSVSIIENPVTNLGTLKRIAEILVQLFRTVSTETSNDEFFTLISRFAASTTKNVKLFMLYTLETFAEFTFNEQLLVNHANTFVGYFDKYLRDADADVKLDAASSFVTFLSFLENEEHIAGYKSAFPMLIEILIEAVKSDEERGLKMINSLDMLIKSHPRFVKDSLDKLLDVFTEMAAEKCLAASLRIAAMLTIISIATKNAATVKKSKVFCDKTLQTFLNILTEQPDDVVEWLKSEDNHELSTNSVQATAVENFSRLNEALGPKFMLQKIIKLAF